MRILSDPDAPADKDVKRLVLCSGKVAYDLMEARNAAGDTDTAIVRIEQLYPFPANRLIVRLKRMTALEEVVWAQEEPKNAGSWSFVDPFIEECLLERKGQADPRALCRTQGRRSDRNRPCQTPSGRAGRVGCRRPWS
jgi:2-oxoglutarate dehydrogenase E1 component